MKFLLVLLAGLAMDGPAAAEPRVLRDLEFAVVDGHSLKLDLYLPGEEFKHPPLFVWIHGGGWHKGDKKDCKLSWLTGHGYAVASINYRLTDQAIFPAQIHDCKGALRWLRAHAEKYGYSVSKVGVGTRFTIRLPMQQRSAEFGEIYEKAA